ncbi:MAG TPA: DUF5723 family protein [Bacteroidales bacterium]|nr:DUF5723 family protein [Bacteroidales bacterium]
MTRPLIKTNKYCRLIVALLCVVSLHGFSQQYYCENIDTGKYYLSLNSTMEFNSDGLTNNFAASFYNGSFLDNSMKTNALNRLNTNNNILAYLFNTDIYLNIPGKKNNINYYAGFENHNLMEIGFNKNFFQLFFWGNKTFTGQQLSLDDLSYTTLNFQQLKAGISKTWQKNNATYVLTAGVGFNNGQNLMKYEIPYGSLFTQHNAEYLDLNMTIGMKRSDTLHSGFGAENGWGFSADVAYVFRDENNIITCQLEDLGFIRWKKNSQSYSKDTLVHFEGFEISNLFDINGETISGISADSLVNEFAFAKTQDAFSEMIPMRIFISYKRYLFKRWLSLTGSLNSYAFSVYRPQLRLTGSLNIPVKNSVISICPSIEAGGYGRFNCGLGVSAAINKKFYVELQTAYINSYLFPKKSAGLGGFISIIKTL